MKNYVSFVNDHSGSMASLRAAACSDFNTNIQAIKEAASRETLDTVVSVAEVGYPGGLTITVSNPHVLVPKQTWNTGGGTPLWTETLNLLNMLKALPDANRESVSFLVIITTDGEATDHAAHPALANAMKPLLATGRWTFVARVPNGINSSYKRQLLDLGIPEGNIQLWDTTTEGMRASTQVTTKAVDTYFAARASGARSSTVFYADASQVNTKVLQDITKDVSLYTVPAQDSGIEIKDFILRHRMEYLKGAAFYQLTKTESRVSHTKQILVRDRSNGKIFAGNDARKMIGLPTDRNARLHPGDHKNYDLFIQSESVNRKLVGGTGVVYWPAIGKPFTEADLAFLKPKVPAVVQLPAVPVTNKPTPSPIPKAVQAPKATPDPVFTTREWARLYCRQNNIPQFKIQRNPGGGWTVKN